MRWNVVLPILLAMVVGHLFSPVVRADSIVATDRDGFKMTITPGATATPETEEYFGVAFPVDHPTCIGAYETSQEATVAVAREYNLRMARINAANRARSYGRNGGGLRRQLNLNYRVN